MHVIKKNWEHIVLIVSIGVGSFARLWNIRSFDLVADNALYSFRSLGLLDYIGGGQTTPIQWFESVPAWAYLSFHDAPPLVFWIKHFFFTILGDSTFASQIPFFLFYLISAYLIYKLVCDGSEKRTATLSVLVFSIMSLAVWASLVGIIEGIQIAFILASMLALLKASKEDYSGNWFYFWCLFTGLALLAKYTSLFLIPAAVIFVLIVNRKMAIRNLLWRKVTIGFIIFLLALSPALIYNGFTLATRGHFDAALSSIVGMDTDDFPGLAGRKANFKISNFYQIGKELGRTSSTSFLVLFAISMLFVTWTTARRKLGEYNDLVLIVSINTLLMLLMIAFSGRTDARFLQILAPFMAIYIGIFATMYMNIRNWSKSAKFIAITVLMVVLGVEAIYTINNHVFSKITESRYFTSEIRMESRGWNELEKHLRAEIFEKPLKLEKIEKLDELFAPLNIHGKNVVFYDDRLDWFAYSWYIQKYQTYYRVPFLPASSMEQFDNVILKSEGSISPTGVYLVSPLDDKQLDSVRKNDNILTAYMESLVGFLEENQAPRHTTLNAQMRPAFNIYKIR